jgi:predicted DNA-binding transcriptional regulator AlpA
MTAPRRQTPAARARALARTGHAARGLSEPAAAHYIGVSESTFRELVTIGRMPTPRQIGARLLWDIHDLDAAFDALPRAGDPAPPGQRPARGVDVFARVRV